MSAVFMYSTYLAGYINKLYAWRFLYLLICGFYRGLILGAKKLSLIGFCVWLVPLVVLAEEGGLPDKVDYGLPVVYELKQLQKAIQQTAALKGKNIIRGAYESDAEYLLRLERNAEIVILSGVKAGDRVAVDLHVPDWHLTYNPNTEVLSAGMGRENFFNYQPNGLFNGLRTCMVVNLSSQEMGRYIGQNYFGAKFNVAKKKENIDCVAIADKKSPLETGYIIEGSVSRGDAVRLNKNHQVVAVGKIAPPYLVVASESRLPTVADLEQVQKNYSGVWFSIEEIVLINKKSNEVLLRRNVR